MKSKLFLIFLGFGCIVAFGQERKLSIEELRLEYEKSEQRLKDGSQVQPTSDAVKAIATALVEVERKGNVGQLRSDDPQLAYIKKYLEDASEDRRFGVLLALRINQFTFPIYRETLESISDPELCSRLILNGIERNKSLTAEQKQVLLQIGIESLYKNIEDAHDSIVTQRTLYTIDPQNTIALMTSAISSGKIKRLDVIEPFMNFIKKSDPDAYSRMMRDIITENPGFKIQGKSATKKTEAK